MCNWLGRVDRNQGGFAMMTVIMGMTAMIFFVLLIYQDGVREYTNAQDHRRDDTVIVGAEGMLQRYASKLTVDPLYYLHYVDEFEMPRKCTSSGPNNDDIVQPGNPWFPDCTEWEYEDGTPLGHPLLEGDPLIDSDNVNTLLAVVPPGVSDSGVNVTVVSNISEFGQTRSLIATIAPESISEFAFLVDQDLRFGSGANIHGKIYVGGDLNFRPTPEQGIVHRDALAEGQIGNLSGYGPPIFTSGSQGFTGSGPYTDIRTVYENPLDFSSFWDDLDLLRNVACGGGGLCLSHTDNPSLGLASNPTAWLLEPKVGGSDSTIKVWAAYSDDSYSCVTSEEWWWINSRDAAWSLVGVFDVPANGAVWVDGHAVIGQEIGVPSKVKDSFTVMAGSAGSRKNIIIGSDIIYTGGLDTTVLGLIATDEVYVNPAAVEADNELVINAAILTQGGAFHVARDCGSDGNVILPTSGGVPISELTTNGSFAMLHTGDVSAHFSPRNYGFDERFETLRPPFFPLLGDSWNFTEWREQPLPCWAIPGSCP